MAQGGSGLDRRHCCRGESDQGVEVVKVGELEEGCLMQQRQAGRCSMREREVETSFYHRRDTCPQRLLAAI